jgi:hypothetical protein
MRLMFVYYAFRNQGSGLVIKGYADAATRLGHEVVVYGRPHPGIPLNWSLDVASADAVVFIFEWTTHLRSGDELDLLRLVAEVPRRRRVVFDGDGNYNEPLRAGADYNHPDEEASRRWTEICDALSDKICQPTLHPLRPNVRPFLFYAYNPAWERPLHFSAKEYGMVYVGHSKFRWAPMQRVLQAIEPIRDRVGRIGLVGEGWGRPPWWATPMGIEHTYYSDSAYLEKLGVDLLPPVPFDEVIDSMTRALLNPVLLRPTFERMRLVNPRMFETPAAGTIPLLNLDPAHIEELYGQDGLELALGHDASERIADALDRPEYYGEVVTGVRDRLARRHSHTARLQELVEIVES